MALDQQDYQMMKSIRDAVRAGDEVMANLLRQMNERDAKTQSAMVDAFNKVAKQLETLTTEIRELRSDLAPKLDKKKVPRLLEPKQ